ncbi:DDB1- and CUL4-associated factor 8-like [Artemia franciscana]
MKTTSGSFLVEDIGAPSTSQGSGGINSDKTEPRAMETDEVSSVTPSPNELETSPSFRQRMSKKRNYRSRDNVDSSESENDLRDTTFDTNAGSVPSDFNFNHTSDSSDANESRDHYIPLSPYPEEDQDNAQNEVATSSHYSPPSRSIVSSSDTEDDITESSIRRTRNATRRRQGQVPAEVNRILEKKPKIDVWNVVKELRKWESHLPLRKSIENLIHSAVSTVKKMDSLSSLEFHNGCVNGLHFNQSGTRLASGSDDLKVAVWDWAAKKMLFSFPTGHKGNVFQAKFLPFNGDTHIITSARDGQVRLAELCPSGAAKTRRLVQHRGPCHKLTSVVSQPHLVLSAGEDAFVYEIDVRERKGRKACLVKEDGSKVPLYSIQGHPLDSNYVLLGGCDQYARVCDRRSMRVGSQEYVARYCPSSFNSGTETRAHITSCVYSNNGTEILASYNDDDIYLFDSSNSEAASHQYVGARNSATVKGVNFFGPNSEYIISGSDCGHVFFWDKETEAIVNILPGDINGVVNVLEPHPSFPILATSGLDDDIKLWAPIGRENDKTQLIKEVIGSNFDERENDGSRAADSIDGELLWMLWRHLNRTERRRRFNDSATVDNGEESDGSEENNRDEDTARRRMECRMA